MHIGINAQLLSFSQNYRNGGVSRYIRYLLTELAKRPGSHEYTVFVNGQDVVERLEALTAHSHITYIAAPWSESQPATRIVWEQFTLPALIRQKQLAVLHSPVNVLPERLPQHCAGVVTLHDLAFLRFPGVLTPSKRLYQRIFTVRSIQRAAKVIAVSESTRQDAIQLVRVPPERVETVYTCIDERFSHTPDPHTIQAFREEQGLAQGYILYLGTLEPRKNLPTLIEAYAQLRNRYGRTEKLVLAGGKGWFYEAIFDRVRQCGLESEVIFPGYVGDDEQVLWYTAASVFVYPSLYEGFGIPVTEALVSGTPAVTSSVSSLPEAGADIALIVDPLDVAAMAEAMHTALTDEAYRQRCQTMAPTVAQQFSAQRMVDETIRVYEQAAISHTTAQGRTPRVTFVR